MITRRARSVWKGALAGGSGTMTSRTLDEPYSFATRFEDEEGVNPEEMIGAALTGCFAMALSLGLDEAGHTPTSVDAEARVHFDPEALEITRIDLDVEGRVPGLDEAAFREHAEEAKENCPVSKALGGVEIALGEARLAGGA